MQLSKVEKLKLFVEDQTDLEIKWYGKYEGRFYFEGYGIYGQAGDIAEFMDRLSETRLGIGHYNHQDNLGFDIIVAWSLSKFDKRTTDQKIDDALPDGWIYGPTNNTDKATYSLFPPVNSLTGFRASIGCEPRTTRYKLLELLTSGEAQKKLDKMLRLKHWLPKETV